MTTSLSGRLPWSRIQATSPGATAAPLQHQVVGAAPAAGLDLRLGPRGVVVVGLVAGQHVGTQPDDVREQVEHRPVRAGRHAAYGLLGRQRLGERPHAAVGRRPGGDGVVAHRSSAVSTRSTSSQGTGSFSGSLSVPLPEEYGASSAASSGASGSG